MPEAREAPRSRQRGRRSRSGAGDWHFVAALAQFLPAVFLPLVAFLFQYQSHSVSWPLVLASCLLGLAISFTVPRGVPAALSTVIVTGLIFGLCAVRALHAKAEAEVPGAPPSGQAFLRRQLLVGSVSPPKPNITVPMETMSIVLPCAWEGEFATKTIQSIWDHTRHSRIKEFIVVDDGGQPPLRSILPQELLAGGPGQPTIHLLRQEKTIGLIGSKKNGGDMATGDVIVFLDCHVRPNDGWEESFLRQMKRAGDHRTVVVPTITSLDPTTWTERKGGTESHACYVLWNADFTWLASPGRDVPLMSGGLLALSRRWWEETGGLDSTMIAWGGENIDQSLRAWLCGGRIEMAENASIAHMWRDHKDPKTAIRYPMPSSAVMRNKARAVLAWFGDFHKKTFTFPEYDQFVKEPGAIGDMKAFDDLREKLHCAPFAAYIQRFSYVYLDSGLIPEAVFQLREEKSGKCLERIPADTLPHELVLVPCSTLTDEVFEAGGGAASPQLWHMANRDRRKPKGVCCSGFANWNFLQCLRANGLGSRVHTWECNIAGFDEGQFFKLQDGQVAFRDRKGCLAPEVPKVAEAGQSPLGDCRSRVEVLAKNATHTTFLIRAPASGARVSGQGYLCAAVVGAKTESAYGLQFQHCEDGASQQVFVGTPFLAGLQVMAGDSGLCLDAAGGSQVLVYPCYQASAMNANQAWHISSGELRWEGSSNGFCVDVKEVVPDATDSSAGQFKLKSCAPKVGQEFRREDTAADGSFILKDPHGGECLDAESHAAGSKLRLAECSGGTRWRKHKNNLQLVHVDSGNCLDAADEVTPIIYPCHQPQVYRKQKFHLIDAQGWIQVEEGWEDNGRKRFFRRCLDYSPEEVVYLTLHRCEDMPRRGIRWTRVDSRAPLEYKLWQSAEKLNPGGYPVLGGDAAPP